ncbi:TPA: hypothetical protein ACWZTV_002023 [Klebsiella pneumoniae]
MINLEQIKADIAARKAMPAWGPQTSIERIKTINATLPSFSLKTVEALVKRIDELESRATTVTLPERYACELGYNSPHPDGDMYDRTDVLAMLTDAGINIAEEDS